MLLVYNNLHIAAYLKELVYGQKNTEYLYRSLYISRVLDAHL